MFKLERNHFLGDGSSSFWSHACPRLHDVGSARVTQTSYLTNSCRLCAARPRIGWASTTSENRIFRHLSGKKSERSRMLGSNQVAQAFGQESATHLCRKTFPYPRASLTLRVRRGCAAVALPYYIFDTGFSPDSCMVIFRDLASIKTALYYNSHQDIAKRGSVRPDRQWILTLDIHVFNSPLDTRSDNLHVESLYK
jgi:hypothetical protein